MTPPSMATMVPRVRRIAMVAAALGGASMATFIFIILGPLVLCTSLSTALLSALLVRNCLLPDRKFQAMRDNVSGRCVGWGCLAGAANVYPASILMILTLIAVEGFTGFPDLEELPGLLLAIGVIGLIVGTPLGLIFSAFYLTPVRLAHDLSVAGAVNGEALLLRRAGWWLIAVGLVTLLFGWGVGIRACTPGGFRVGVGEQMFTLLLGCGPALLAGLIAVVVGRWRLDRLSRWFEGVRAGTDPNWTIVGIWEVSENIDDLVPLFHQRELATGVLLRLNPGPGEGAYRTGVEQVPWALVPLPEREEETHL